MAENKQGEQLKVVLNQSPNFIEILAPSRRGSVRQDAMLRPSLSNQRSECIKSHELQCEEIADADVDPTTPNQKQEDKRNYDLLKEHQKSEIGQIIIYTPVNVQDWDVFSSG